MSGPDDDALAERVAALRRNYRPVFLARLDRIAAAVAGAGAAGTLTEEEREEARRAAHSLAGSLATFGLERGTALARRLEQVLDGPGGTAERAAGGDAVAELRRILDEDTPGGGA